GEHSSQFDASSRQLRSKLTLLSRRIDELEETTKSLHRTEDELMDIQDKIMQAEGSNCSLLAEVDTLRKRMLTIEGKDEEIRKAEGMCRNLKEKLEAEVKLSKDLKRKIEKLQDRMSELERLEEAFNRSKSDCTQLCLSLNEEKNLTRKLTTELEALRARVYELEASEGRLDRSERDIIEELEKLKSLAVVLADEGGRTAGDKLRRNEEDTEELTGKVEPNNRLPAADQSKNSSNLRANANERTGNYTGDLRIEEAVSSGPAKRGYNPPRPTPPGGHGPRNKAFPEGQEEDNKVKDLTQEVEKLKKRLKLLETVEGDLRRTRGDYNELQERFLSEQSRAKALAEQVDELRLQAARGRGPGLENGEPGCQEARDGRARPERPRSRGLPAERERARNRDLLQLEEDGGSRSYRRPLSPSAGRRPHRASSNPRAPEEEKPGEAERLKKPREQPSVLSRYPPAANEPGPGVKRPWGSQAKPSDPGLKYKPEPLPPPPPTVAAERPKRPPASSWVNSYSQPEPGGPSKASDSGEEWPAAPRLLNGSAAPHTQSSSRYRRQRPASPSEQPADSGWAEAEDEELSSAKKVVEEEEPEPPPSLGPARPRYSRRDRREASHEFRAVRCYAEDDDEPPPSPPPPHESSVLQAERVVTAAAEDEEEVEEEVVVVVVEAEVMAAEEEEEEAVVSAEWRPFSPGSGSGPALRRVCSPRESLRSRAVIQPAIVAIDKKRMMTTTAAVAASAVVGPRTRARAWIWAQAARREVGAGGRPLGPESHRDQQHLHPAGRVAPPAGGQGDAHVDRPHHHRPAGGDVGGGGRARGPRPPRRRRPPHGVRDLHPPQRHHHEAAGLGQRRRGDGGGGGGRRRGRGGGRGANGGRGRVAA
uniref:Leucine zipper protein 1 n=1 Tax=Callorhinchus milii TaxID=7868 RepID=A0A4W3JIP1_CALMI